MSDVKTPDMRAVQNSESSAALPISIEITAKQVLDAIDLDQYMPDGTRVYLPQIGNETEETLIKAARRLTDLGYHPVPHIASRRLTTRIAFERRIKAISQEAGATDILVIGGGLSEPAGSFADTMSVLETGLLENLGITDLGVAGHPEGSPDFSLEAAAEALVSKQSFSTRTGIRVRIVSQFAFDADQMIAWADGLRDRGIRLPVHLGIAGPAKLTTLIKYAASCGVGNSISFLRKQRRSLTALTTGYNPEDVLAPVERHIAEHSNSAIQQIHVFPFGGFERAAKWLTERGSWAINSA